MVRWRLGHFPSSLGRGLLHFAVVCIPNLSRWHFGIIQIDLFGAHIYRPSAIETAASFMPRNIQQIESNLRQLDYALTQTASVRAEMRNRRAWPQKI